jgi:hypothetical protein
MRQEHRPAVPGLRPSVSADPEAVRTKTAVPNKKEKRTMAQKAKTYGDVLASWEAMHSAMIKNVQDFPHLQDRMDRLAEFLGRARDFVVRHEEAAAERRTLSRGLRELVREGEKVSTFLRTGLKEHYGNRSEKLIEFGIEPLRRRPRVVKPPEPAGTEPKPEPTAAPSPVPPSTAGR